MMEAILEEKKEQEVRYPFKEIENILYKQAIKMAKKTGDRYELDELVNEVWLKGSIQKLDSIKFISARAYFDMIDYVRSIEGRKHFRNGVLYKRPKAFTNTHEMNYNIGESKNKEDFFCNIEHNNIQPKRKNHVDAISDHEDIENFLSCLTEQQADILKKYFIEGKELTEIAKEYGCKDSNICNHKTNALKKIREVFFIDVETKIDTRRKRKKISDISDIPIENILPEFVVDFEINNESATEKDFVLERDRKE